MGPYRNWQHEDLQWVPSGSKYCLPPSITPRWPLNPYDTPHGQGWGLEARRERICIQREQWRVRAKCHLQRMPRLRGDKVFQHARALVLEWLLAHRSSVEKMPTAWQGVNWLLSTAVLDFCYTRQEFKA